jgi:hypothetical protein
MVRKVEVTYPEAFPPSFHEILGKFHGLWLMFDVHVDYSIGKFLRLTPDETHLLVSGTTFGQKLRLLHELIKRSDHQKKQSLLANIKILQSSNRDNITHAYIKSNRTNVTFMYRARGQYKSGELAFHIDEFSEHVAKMADATIQYQNEFGASEELRHVAVAAIINYSRFIQSIPKPKRLA